MIQMSLSLNKKQWTYNIVDAPRDDGFVKSRTRIHANQWPGAYSKLDLILPAWRTTHRFIYVRLECGFLSAKGPGRPQPFIFVSAVALSEPESAN